MSSFTDPYTTNYGSFSLTSQEVPDPNLTIPPNTTTGYAQYFVGSGDPNLFTATGTGYLAPYYTVTLTATANGVSKPIGVPNIVSYFVSDTGNILIFSTQNPLIGDTSTYDSASGIETYSLYWTLSTVWDYNVTKGTLTELGSENAYNLTQNDTVVSQSQAYDPTTGMYAFNGVQLVSYSSQIAQTNQTKGGAYFTTVYNWNGDYTTTQYELGAGPLFTTGADYVDFNINAPSGLTPAQQAAIAGGADIYHGLGGDDVVTLPSEANYNESVGSGKTLGWTDTAASTFTTGSQLGDTYTVNGSDGSYFIQEGAGTEFGYHHRRRLEHDHGGLGLRHDQDYRKRRQ